MDKQHSRMRDFWEAKKWWLEPARFVFDIAVILVMILSLQSSNNSSEAAHNANDLTRQALRSGYVPWIKLILFSIDRKTDAQYDLNFRLKNFSPTAPAIGLVVRSIVPKVLNEGATYTKDALMPGEEGTQTMTVEGSENKGTIDAIQNGRLPVRIRISCTDIFGTPYMFEEEFRKIGGEYRLTEFLSKGIPRDTIAVN